MAPRDAGAQEEAVRRGIDEAAIERAIEKSVPRRWRQIMKILFDTNVYVSEAMRGRTATLIIQATERAGWRIYASTYFLDELERVISEKLGFSRRLAILSRQRVIRQSIIAEPGTSRHLVPGDPNDSPILKCAYSLGSIIWSQMIDIYFHFIRTRVSKS